MLKCPCCNNKIHSYTILVNNLKKKDITCSKCKANLKCVKNTLVTVIVRILGLLIGVWVVKSDFSLLSIIVLVLIGIVIVIIPYNSYKLEIND